MDISRNSLHYKMVNTVFDFPAENLCLYFWQAVWAFLTLSATVLAVPCFAAVFLILMLSPLLQFFVPFDFGELVFAGGVIDIMILTAFWSGYRKEFYPPQAPGVIGSYIKAKKDKVCPTITFIED